MNTLYGTTPEIKGDRRRFERKGQRHCALDRGRRRHAQRRTKRLTWRDIIAMEPGLFPIDAEVRRIARTQRRFSSHTWESIKSKLGALVDWYRRGPHHPTLNGSTAYEVVCGHLLRLLENRAERAQGGRRTA